MKRNTLTIMLAVLMSMAASVASAYDAQIDGIYYNFDGNGIYAIVTYKGLFSSDYSGSVVIPESVAYDGKTYRVARIGKSAFYGCSGLTSITIPNSVWTIEDSAFDGCSGLTSITIPESVKSIDYRAFSGCSGLTSVTIPNSVTSIGNYAFYGCSGLTSITIPNSVTSIGSGAFSGCSGLTSVTIPNSVTSIGSNAFEKCSSGLTSIKVEEGNAKYDSRDNCNAIIETSSRRLILGCNNTIIPDGVTYIDSYAFYGCSGLTSVTIPSSVKYIGSYVFYGCSGLTSVTIPSGVTVVYDYAFYGCSGLTSVTIPTSVREIYDYAFYGCSSLTSVTIPTSVTNIRSYAFRGGRPLVLFSESEVPPSARSSSFEKGSIAVVPKSYVSLYETAPGWKEISINNGFTIAGTTQASITLSASNLVSDNYVTLENTENATRYYPQGNLLKISGLSPGKTYTMYTHCKYNTTVMDYAISANTKGVNIGSLVQKKITNTTMTIGKPSYDAGDAQVSSAEFVGYEGKDEINITGLAPGETKSFTYRVVTSDGSVFNKESSFQTKMVKASGTSIVNSASSATLKGSLSGLIDATIDKIGFEENGYTSDEIKLTGLNPNTSYTKRFKATFKEGGEAYKDITFRTDALTLETQQPKVISEGNIIVAAKSNLDDEETGVGFEWRRYDWTDDFDSRTGDAYLYEGTMEGYIRSLNPNYLWKFRPYYVANDGTYYYGEWKGMDPSDYSYFEPTVHTYATISVQGNRAEVKGYAMRGTDKLTSQGFMYWANGSSSRKKVNAVPSHATTVVAQGNVMTAVLEGLDYETTYCYVAFVTTEEGETFYGEEQTFTTGEGDPDGIENISSAPSLRSEETYYDLNGRKLSSPQKGLNIIRYSDGTTHKVLIK